MNNGKIKKKTKRTITFEDNVYTNLPVNNWLFKAMSNTLGSLDFTMELFHDPEMETYVNSNNIYFRTNNPQMNIVLNSLCRSLYSLKFVLRESIDGEEESK